MTFDAKAVMAAAKKIAEEADADVFLLNAPFAAGVDSTVKRLLRERNRRPNVIVIVVSNGGNPDAAYRIARAFQDRYTKFTAILSGPCKSAGTLCILGAHELAFADDGELGPLDIQYYKKDEISEMASGLVVMQALNKLQSHAFQVFEQNMMGITLKSSGQISFKLASEVACRMAVGVCEPLYRQIDPVVLGDLERGMTIGKDYGERLRVKGNNFSTQTLDQLAESYSSHGFVIDAREAKEIFTNVRDCTDNELLLLDALDDYATEPKGIAASLYLSPEVGETIDETADIPSEAGAKSDTRGGERGDAENPKSADGSREDGPPHLKVVAKPSP